MAKRNPSTFERLTSGKLNRKQRKELMRRVYAGDPGLEVAHPDAGAVDVGNESHFAAAPPGRNPQPVQEFGCRTADLKRMAAWFIACGVKTVVMQSTGVYWIAVHDVPQPAPLVGFSAAENSGVPGHYFNMTFFRCRLPHPDPIELAALVPQRLRGSLRPNRLFPAATINAQRGGLTGQVAHSDTPSL